MAWWAGPLARKKQPELRTAHPRLHVQRVSWV